MEGRTLKLEAWRVFRPVVTNPHHLDEEQIRIRIRIEVKSWIRIRIKVKRLIRILIGIKVMRIRNPDHS
jgi:hypothetical protein